MTSGIFTHDINSHFRVKGLEKSMLPLLMKLILVEDDDDREPSIR